MRLIIDQFLAISIAWSGFFLLVSVAVWNMIRAIAISPDSIQVRGISERDRELPFSEVLYTTRWLHIALAIAVPVKILAVILL